MPPLARPVLAIASVSILAACGIEYRPAKSGADSARAVAAAESARAAERQVDTVTRVDTLVRVDTVLVRDSLIALGGAPDPVATSAIGTAPVDSLRLVPRPALPSAPVTPRVATPSAAMPAVTPADLDALRRTGLRVPVEGVRAADVPDSFHERRGTGEHQALDILAPRGTRVLAAADGRVVKLFESRAGGHTVYVVEPGGRFMLYYAHLDGYRPGLAEGQAVRAGDVLGTVGSTGNASPAAPHLHFAVARVADAARWWEGTAIDPHPFLR